MQIFKNDENLFKLINYSRFFLYNAEGFPILLLRKFLGLTRKPNPAPPKGHEKKLMETIKSMITEDIENYKNKIYPKTLLYPENPIKHFIRYSEVFADAFFSSLRAKNNKYNEFSKEVKDNLENYPKYYQRNFHFQTDGYLTKKSAYLYSHQTEILFKGSLALTRRLLMANILKFIHSQKRTLKILELACGSGESTEILLKSCPNIELTATDLSSAYIDFSKEKTKDFSNVRYQVLDATHVDKINEHYDIIFSVYLFHEIPEKERNLVIQSSYKQLKPNGLMINIDSIQLNDIPEFNWALLNFPKDFHEPFYTNYIKRPLHDVMKNNHFQNIETNMRFLSKSVSGFKLS